MTIKSDVRYRIDTLLRMANITNNEEKRNQYLLTIEELLSCGDSLKIDTVEVPFGDEEKMKIVNVFVDNFGESNIVGKTNTQVFDSYVEFCNDINKEPISKIMFSKYLRKSTGIYPIAKKINNKKVMIYVNS